MRVSPIQDYAVIGDCRSAALISKDGSLDWLCWPKFDSPSLFAALLDADQGGFWRIGPTTPARVERHYEGDTNVLVTRFETTTGSFTLTDFMPVSSEEEKKHSLVPEREILRIVRCEGGRVSLSVDYAPRPRFGRLQPMLRAHGPFGYESDIGTGLLHWRCTEHRPRVTREAVHVDVELKAGESFQSSLIFSEIAPPVLPPLGERAEKALERTLRWWHDWAARTRYEGPRRDMVVRSALVLKLLAFAPSGAIIAAPTTSLPEQIGGSLNWDYRFCWLRDASLTARALFGLGHHDEAGAFVNWMLTSTRLTWPKLKILYDVYGNVPHDEKELDHLSGYRHSRPVRVGNAAAKQLQLDVYGEVIEATAQYLLHGGRLDHESETMLARIGKYVSKNWQLPDEGIWESRHGQRPHTFSRLMCWAALDRLVDLGEREHVGGLDLQALRKTRNEIRREIETRAWDPVNKTYTGVLETPGVDASLLLMPWYGFTGAASPRMRKTWERIRTELGAGQRLLYRYLPRPGEEEAAFGICSFWGAEYLALGGGSVEEAEEAFRELLEHSNDVGLYAEEIDPRTGAAIGNFPQGFTHIGLINAALSLEERLRERERFPSPCPRSEVCEEARV